MADGLNRFVSANIRQQALRFSVLHGLLLVLSSTVQAEISDPTRPPPGYSELELSGMAGSVPQAPALVVSTLFLMGDKPYALVDGQIVRLGDPLADGKVVKIDASGVWIAVPTGNKTRTRLRQLKWLPEVVKTPSKARMEKK